MAAEGTRTVLFYQMRSIWIPSFTGVCIGVVVGIVVGVISACWGGDTCWAIFLSCPLSVFLTNCTLWVGRSLEDVVYPWIDADVAEDRAITPPWLAFIGSVACCGAVHVAVALADGLSQILFFLCALDDTYS
uniref:Uncharacterized protein n=1 Tax=Lotharella oceanica TaxID=641309 RepID=A0A7S2TU61_9EUKA